MLSWVQVVGGVRRRQHVEKESETFADGQSKPEEETMLLDFMDAHRAELVDFTARLVATPSPNLPGDERAVVEVIQTELTRLGLEGAEVVAKHPDRPNLLLRLQGQQPGPTLMLCGHSDTKPVGDLSAWKTDPLVPVIENGKMYGLGTTDMKGAVAAMVYATAALKGCVADLAGDLLLVINADEERTMEFGSGFLSSDYGLRADIALLGEPSGIDGPEFEYLHVVSRGISCFKVRVRGTQMHSSLTDRLEAVNAHVVLARVLTFMQERLALTFTSHPLCPAPTVNLGVQVTGGVGYGVCPGVAEFQSDIRVLPGMTHAQLKVDLQRCLEACRQEMPGLEVELEFESPPLDWFPPTEVSTTHPLVDQLLQASEQVLGFRPQLSTFPGGSDAKNFQGTAGIPTIPSFGPGWLPLAHGPNECVGVESLVQAAKIYAVAAQAYLSGDSARGDSAGGNFDRQGSRDRS